MHREKKVIAAKIPVRKHSDIFYQLVFLASLSFLVFQILLFFDFIVDDAYISFRYARNFAKGFNFVYNLGEYVEGYTNFLWVFILGICQFVIGVNRDITLVAKFLGIVSAVLILVVSSGLPQAIFSPGQWMKRYYRLELPLILAMTTAIPVYAVSGMETIFASALVLLGFYHLIKHNGKHLTTGMIFLVLAALARFDLLLIYGCAILVCLNFRILHKGPAEIKSVILEILPSALIYAVYTLFRIYTYGDLYPNTFYAKTENYELSARYMKMFFSSTALTYFAPFIILRLLNAIWYGYFPQLLASAICAVFLVYLYFYGIDWMPWYRFTLPIIPLLIFLVVDSLLWFFKYPILLIRKGLKFKRHRWLLVFGISGFYLCCLLFALHLNLLTFIFQRQQKKYWLDEIFGTAAIMKTFIINSKLLAHLLNEQHLVYTDIGGTVSYFTNARILEAWGLTDPVIARCGERDYPTLPKLFGRFHPTYIAQRQPDYLLIVCLSSSKFIPADKVPEAVFGWEYLKELPEFNPNNYRVGYLWSKNYPDHYVYFLEKRGIKTRPFDGEKFDVKLVYQN